MSYEWPAYLAAAGADDPQIRYIWDDSRASEDFSRSADDAVHRILSATPRAQVVAGIGIYEWILWRFHRLSADPLPFQVGEAAWCAAIDRRYMKDAQPARFEWLGPVRGPLWCAITWLVPMLLQGPERPEEYESGLRYLSRLALHVLPQRPPFEDWLERVADRLLQCHPAPPADPYAGLFDVADPALLGELIPREALDPDRAYDPGDARLLLSRYLEVVDRSNPLLASPQDMLRQGFTGTPYSLGPQS